MAGDKHDPTKVSHERDVSMRLFPYGTALRTQKMLAAENILREEYPAYSELVKALEATEVHIAELREAWQRGVIKEHDGQGGTRSNRNADIHRQIQAALAGRKR